MKHVFTVGCLPLFVSMAMASLQSDAGAASAGGEHSVVERGPHHRVWERVEQERQPDGSSVSRVHSYKDLATGLHYVGPDGQLKESREEIEILPKGAGAVAALGQHKVYFPPTLDGQIELNTPDGKWLRSRVLGLAYEDADGKSVLIAEIKPSVGTLVGSNVMVYADAFDGVSASVRYTYTLAAFEQDVVIQGQLPSQEKFGLTDNVKVQVLTEFDATEPQREVRVQNGLRDEHLSWGAMRMGRGTGFALGEERNRRQGEPIAKRWEKLLDSENGGIERTFLIEEVDYRKIEPKLRNLPVRTAMNSTATNSVLNRVASKRLLPAPKLARYDSHTNAIQLAKAEVLVQPGYVLDYTIINMSQSDLIFFSGQTYYVSSSVYLSGTITIQGAVIKFAQGTDIYPGGPFDFQTTLQERAILTAVDDDTVGETISSSSGTPSGYYASWGFGTDWTGEVDYHDLEIRYATWGIVPASGVQTVRNCRFIHTGIGIWAQSSITEIKAYNVLFENVTTAFGCNPYNCNGTPYSVDAQHVTYHDVTQKKGSSSITLTELNCLFDNDPDTYATGMDGERSYLAANSPHRNEGTTSIDSTLLTAIRTMTTYAPQHGNYPDTDPPDLGYHYPVTVNMEAEFWIAFPNMYAPTLSLFISSPTTNYGSVSIPGIPWNQDFAIAAGMVETIPIPLGALLYEYDGTPTEGDPQDGIENKGIHIVASNPVSVYAVDLSATASATFTAYPLQQLGTNYHLMAYTSCGVGASQFAVIAAAEGTTHVTITPSVTANLIGTGHSGQYSVDLVQGQTYQIQSTDPTDDVTGTLVTSDKPIAVFAGAFGPYVPCARISANPMVQQQLPTNLWGQDVMAIPFAGREGDALYRVLAATNGTEIFTNGTLAATLNAGECYPPAGEDAVAIGGNVTFHGSGPIQVAQFAHGQDAGEKGDPLEILLPPVSRWLTSYIVATPSTDVPPYLSFDQHYLTVIVPTAAKETTYVNGVNADTLGTFEQIQSSGYWGVQIPRNAETSYSVTSSQPISVQVYGWGYTDSYGYSGN